MVTATVTNTHFNVYTTENILRRNTSKVARIDPPIMISGHPVKFVYESDAGVFATEMVDHKFRSCAVFNTNESWRYSLMLDHNEELKNHTFVYTHR